MILIAQTTVKLPEKLVRLLIVFTLEKWAVAPSSLRFLYSYSYSSIVIYRVTKTVGCNSLMMEVLSYRNQSIDLHSR